MSQYSWTTCPRHICQQVEAVVAGTRTCFGKRSIVGKYLHWDRLRPGALTPDRSDIDLLVLISQQPTPLDRRGFAELMLELSGRSVAHRRSASFRRRDVVPWKYPTHL